MVPMIEAGNMLYKSMVFFAKAKKCRNTGSEQRPL